MGTPDLGVTTMGACRIDSPLTRLLRQQGTTQHYVDESDRVLFDDTVAMLLARGVALADLPGFEPGGPRRKRVGRAGRYSSTRRRPGSASSPAAACARASTTSSGPWCSS